MVRYDFKALNLVWSVKRMTALLVENDKRGELLMDKRLKSSFR